MSELKLFSPYILGDITLKNRVVMGPMTRSRAHQNNAPEALNATYYGQRAEAGLIITEGTSPSPNGIGYPRIPGMYSPEQIEGWKLVTEAVHRGDSHIFIQLMHTGRVTHEANLPDGAQVLAPTDKILSGEMYTDEHGMQPHSAPKAMTVEEVQSTIEEYVQAARNAIEAGFDGVEIHGANGYLVEQFLSPHSNDRTDEYGGSIENRARFAIEVAKGMIDAIGKERVGIRLSPYGVFNDMPPYEEIDETYTYLAKAFDELGLVYVHVVDHSAMGAPEVPEAIKLAIRENYSGTLILSGGYDRDRAEADLEAGKGDLVAFSRPFIANPDLVTRMKIGAELAAPDQNTFYSPGEKGYTDYPFLEPAQSE